MKRLLRFTLDLFQPMPVAPPATPKPPPPPVAVTPRHPRHPRATREALLNGKLVGYEIKRGKRRTIGFSVGVEGLAVSAPKWVSLREIDRAVQEKSGWILKKLDLSHELDARRKAARIEWKDGAVFQFLGQPLVVRIDPRCTHAALGCADSHAGGVSRQTLCLPLALCALPEEIRSAVERWWRAEALLLFTERLNHFMAPVGVRWTKLSLSSATTRWGSASASGAIRLNWKLLHFGLPVIDYVVVHELSHLRVMDHSPRFWATVAEVIPDHLALRRQLKSEVAARW